LKATRQGAHFSQHLREKWIHNTAGVLTALEIDNALLARRALFLSSRVELKSGTIDRAV
jgi:hypothetical protein